MTKHLICLFQSKLLSKCRMFSTTSNSTGKFAFVPTVPPAKRSSNNQLFDYFLVLDFEATCDHVQPTPQEIIEFPILKVNGKSLEIEDQFHYYVKPQVYPNLSTFCTELTGIMQFMVDSQPDLVEILKLFDTWMEENEFKSGKKSFAFVTCGDWDLNKMLPSQCSAYNIPVPFYFNSWINLKKVFLRFNLSSQTSMMGMLKCLNIQHVGRHHSGIDDCRNIALILTSLIRSGAIPNITMIRE